MPIPNRFDDKKQLGSRIPASLLADLKTIAFHKATTMTELVNEMVESFVRKHNRETPVAATPVRHGKTLRPTRRKTRDAA